MAGRRVEAADVCRHEVSAVRVLTVPAVPHKRSTIYRHTVGITK